MVGGGEEGRDVAFQACVGIFWACIFLIMGMVGRFWVPGRRTCLWKCNVLLLERRQPRWLHFLQHIADLATV